MDSVKRRLVYVADDEEVMLDELSATPPARPSRMSRLHISSSDKSATRNGSRGGKAASEEVRGSLTLPAASLVDPLLLLSYDGFLFADGSGTLRTPRTAAEAYRLLAALKDCHDFLRSAVHLDAVKQLSDLDWSSSSSSTSSSSSDSSSTYAAEQDELALSTEADDEDDGERSATRRRARRRRGKGATEQRKDASCDADAGAMTVAQLRHQLRQHSLPVTGTKQVLQQRLQLYLESTQASSSPAPHDETQTVTGGEKENVVPAPQIAATAGRASCGHGMQDDKPRNWHAVHGDATVPRADDCRRTPGEEERHVAPPHRVDEERASSRRSVSGRASRGLWEALVNVGTRLFGQQGGRHSAQRDATSASPWPTAAGDEAPHERAVSSPATATPVNDIARKRPRDE